MALALRLYKEENKLRPSVTTKPLPFPGSGDKQALLTEYTYSSSRMGNAPVVSGTIKWPTCLDDEWSDAVFVTLNGERFYINNTPSSSYDNTSTMYTHSVELVSERVVLDNVYFFDAVKVEGDESLSDNPEFSFSGDIHMFADRLNISLERSGVGGAFGYRVVVDDGIESESKLIQVSNQFVSEVLKSAYETYEIPFYFTGKVIHFGNYETFIETDLEYGADKSLMSISKSNSNKRIINRITGNGSDRNIPYYYPNPTPEGYLLLDGESKDKYIITDPLKFCSKVKIDKPFTLKVGEFSDDGLKSVGNFTEYIYSDNVTVDSAYKVTCKIPSGISKLTFKLNKTYGDLYMPEYIPVTFSQLGNIFMSGELKLASLNQKVYSLSLYNDNSLKIDGGSNINASVLRGAEFSVYLDVKIATTITMTAWTSQLDVFEINNVSVGTAQMATFTSEITVTGGGRCNVYLTPTFTKNSSPIPLYASFSSGEVWANESKVTFAYIKNNHIYCGKLHPGTYELRFVYRIYQAVSPTDVDLTYSNGRVTWWEYMSGGDEIDPDKSGFGIAAGQTQQIGDTLIKRIEKRVNVQTSLMPSIYRDTDGDERWYNAVNDKYTDADGKPVVFENEYVVGHPREYVHEVEDIYPTIKGMTNKFDMRIDMFSEIAFDQHDNNDVYPEDYEDEKLAGKYKHPYFFAKLRRTDSTSKLKGFNLFDCAIESETMKISFTSGHVASCEFEIGVDEESKKNPVQVDADGNLVRDDEGNVVYRGAPQDVQQNTLNNEVWIALKKEESTMGVMMPDTNNFIVPTTSDTFVILGIHLPEAYILAAEKRLEDELIKYLAENNREKFTFSLKLSSIFLAENPSIAAKLNENCKVTLIYDGKPYEMYVNNYSYSVKESSSLAEVTITLDDELKIHKPKNKEVINLINSTNNKLNVIVGASATLSAQVLSATTSIQNVTDRLITLETNISDVDISLLSANVADNSLIIATHGDLLTFLTNEVEYHDERITRVEAKTTVLVITPDEN